MDLKRKLTKNLISLDRQKSLKNLKFNPDDTELKLASGARTQKERSLEKKLIIKSQKKNILKSLEDQVISKKVKKGKNEKRSKLEYLADSK